MQAETHDGVPSNETGEFFHKNDKIYSFVRLNKDQPDGVCHNYRVRFLCGKLVRPHASITIQTRSNSSILQLEDDAQSWWPGDKVVVASTDFSMHQAEEFQTLPCPSCATNQVKVQGSDPRRHKYQAEPGPQTSSILARRKNSLQHTGRPNAGSFIQALRRGLSDDHQPSGQLGSVVPCLCHSV
ncbi:hypothetical protein MATL_G00101050 [Megalops atlanticus]|uniref:WxxW domain-containing protein n=1 Tax=Megalops atlanticus TaxID=7932 RepID=A0A9D3TF03_MEGAT|nr:hypothetical protein MATL_G00101050 [Megalops atlanticus]